MQKDNIKNINNLDRDNITNNDNSSIIINGDRSVNDFMGIIKRDREWREVEPQKNTPTVYKDNVIQFPITSNVEILTPVPPKNIA